MFFGGHGQHPLSEKYRHHWRLPEGVLASKQNKTRKGFNNISSSSNCTVRSKNITRQGAGLLVTQKPVARTSGCGHPGMGSCHHQSSTLGTSGIQRSLKGRESCRERPGAGRLHDGQGHHQPGQVFPFYLLPGHLSWPGLLELMEEFSSVRQTTFLQAKPHGDAHVLH